MSDTFENLLERFTGTVEAGDGTALADLFAPDGIYHDTFYGAFQGHVAIKAMLEDRFWGDAEAFLWDMVDPVFDAGRNLGYARWVFSYTSTMEGSAGKRVAFDGFSQFTLEGKGIRLYREVFSAGIALVQLAMDPARTDKILRRMVEKHKTDPEWGRHISK